MKLLIAFVGPVSDFAVRVDGGCPLSVQNRRASRQKERRDIPEKAKKGIDRFFESGAFWHPFVRIVRFGFREQRRHRFRRGQRRNSSTAEADRIVPEGNARGKAEFAFIEQVMIDSASMRIRHYLTKSVLHSSCRSFSTTLGTDNFPRY